MIELQQKNKVLTRCIKTLEERLKQRENNNIVLTDVCTQWCLQTYHPWVHHWVEKLLNNIPTYYDTMIYQIKTPGNKAGARY